MKNKRKTKTWGPFLIVLGDLDIKSPNHLLKCIISNDKSYKEMIFGSIRTLNAGIRLSLGQEGPSLGYYI